MRILVVEDDESVRAALRRALIFAGYEVLLAGDGEAGLLAADAAGLDAIVLDLGLPTIDGLEVCRQLRARGDQTPILMLTARDAVDDRVDGLEAGGDDYLVKPYDVRELRARLRAIVRRHGDDVPRSLRFGPLELDPGQHAALTDGQTISLTRTEYQLLELFLLSPRQVLTAELIYERVWGYDVNLASNSLRVYIGYLRRKLEAHGAPRLIQTVHGVGYVLREPAAG